MIKRFFLERLSIITSVVLGSSAGYSMSAFIDVAEIKGWLTSIAISVSLLLSFFISLVLKHKRDQATIDKATVLFRRLIIAFVAFVLVFFLVYRWLTIFTPVQASDGQISDSMHITRGLYYTPKSVVARNDYFALHHEYQTDKVLLSQWLFKVDDVWSDDSRIWATLILIVSYSLVIISLTAGITIAIELASIKKATAPKKTAKLKKTSKNADNIPPTV